MYTPCGTRTSIAILCMGYNTNGRVLQDVIDHGTIDQSLKSHSSRSRFAEGWEHIFVEQCDQLPVVLGNVQLVTLVSSFSLE